MPTVSPPLGGILCPKWALFSEVLGQGSWGSMGERLPVHP